MTTKIEEAFDAAWDDLPNVSAVDKVSLAKAFFVLGARAFSTMPLCRHGVAVWGVEQCELCTQAVEAKTRDLVARKETAVSAQDFELVATLRDQIEKLKAGIPGEFPGYNRPFEIDLPQGMTQGHLEDLRAEHEAMRATLLSVLSQNGVVDVSANAPWDAMTVIHMAGLWLSGALPFVKKTLVLTEAIRRLEQRAAGYDQVAAQLEGRVAALEKKEEKTAFICGSCGSGKVRRTSPKRPGEVRCRSCKAVGQGVVGVPKDRGEGEAE